MPLVWSFYLLLFVFLMKIQEIEVTDYGMSSAVGMEKCFVSKYPSFTHNLSFARQKHDCNAFYHVLTTSTSVFQIIH